ncbi:MAG: sigma-70 family RNA polymerase sigma factor [Deltaproteobacteria bacterium]|nr:sigma-70 family RNA polymerase sigma factor [Deltaproteobacteria bacterium]
MIEEEESGLLARARVGDFDAFEALVSRSEGKVYSHLLRLVANEEDARDLLQETYLSAYKSLGSFKGDSAFSTWVYRIATNHALMKLRRKTHQEVALDDVQIPSHEELKGRTISDWQVDPREALLRSELRGVLDEAVGRLPALYRAVVLMRDVEELSTEETAQSLGITEGAVKTRLHRARIFLREELAPYFEGDGGETLTGKAR